MEAAEEREERVTKHAKHPEVMGEAARRTARAQRAGFASSAEEERHSR